MATISLSLFTGGPLLYAYAPPKTNGTVPTGSVDVPIRVRAGHVFVELEINGKGPLHFLFDTGASNVLTPTTARSLGLTVRGNVEAVGTGGTQIGGSTKVDSVRLGGLSLPDQSFYVLDLPPDISDDSPVDGLIGFEWLDRFPMRLDYANSTLTLYTDKGAHHGGTTTPNQLHFRGRTPQIDGEVDGIAGRFSIDTGSAGSLTLSAPFVAEHDLAMRYHAKTRIISARGIGGPVYALMARAELLKLGTAAVKSPVTFLSQQLSGTSSRKDTAGNVGYGILRQFTLFFDYRHKEIYFDPNKDWGQQDLADRSGLRLERSGEALSVAFVAEKSPAQKAGLKLGDRILTVEKAPTSELTLDQVRALLKSPVGTAVSMTTDHGSILVVLEDL